MRQPQAQLVILTMNGSLQNHTPTFIVFPVKTGKVRCEIHNATAAKALVITTMGSASYRRHPFTAKLSESLASKGITNVLADLLTPEEFAEHRYRFDGEKISARLRLLVKYLRSLPEYRTIPFGLFGGGTGAEGALTAAARMPREIQALVCMDGLRGMEQSPLDNIFCPTLLIAHNNDTENPSTHEQTESRLKSWCMLEKMRGGNNEPLHPEVDSITGWFRQFLLTRGKRMFQTQPLAIHA